MATSNTNLLAVSKMFEPKNETNALQRVLQIAWPPPPPLLVYITAEPLKAQALYLHDLRELTRPLISRPPPC